MTFELRRTALLWFIIRSIYCLNAEYAMEAQTHIQSWIQTRSHSIERPLQFMDGLNCILMSIDKVASGYLFGVAYLLCRTIIPGNECVDFFYYWWHL